MVIYKITLELTTYQDINLEYDAEILAIQPQDDDIVLWYKCTEGLHTIRRTIEIIGTGRTFEKANRKYLSTVQMSGFVWHIFERG
jgi:hypothetical protein